VCDPGDEENCVEFCSRITPECAVPWYQGISCLLPNEQAFRLEVFHRDTADRPEVILQGRVVDDAARRVDGARVTAWFQGTQVADETSGKDGSFHLRLRVNQQPYTLRITHVGLATEIQEVHLDKAGTPPPKTVRLGPESAIKGRVLDGAGQALAGAAVRALRAPDDAIETSFAETSSDGSFALQGLEARRYVIRASKFGWLPSTVKGTIAAPTKGLVLRLAPTGVISGLVKDADGDPQANAIVVALLSGGLGSVGSPIIWSTDGEGKFSQDRFQPGTYYLWARHGEMLAYPPVKLELTEAIHHVEGELQLGHKGARVQGKLETTSGAKVDGEARVVLLGRSPLAMPRKVVGDINRGGQFTVRGVLPGRYEVNVRAGARLLPIAQGPRDVEVPIEAGATVELPEAIVVRPTPDE